MTRRANIREMYAVRTGRLTRRGACTRKHQFTQARAIRLAAKRSRETGDDISAYPCLFGDHWHIGHSPHR